MTTPEIDALLSLITRVWSSDSGSWRTAVAKPQYVEKQTRGARERGEGISVPVAADHGRTARIIVPRNLWGSRLELQQQNERYVSLPRWSDEEGIYLTYKGCTCAEHDPAGCARHPFRGVQQ